MRRDHALILVVHKHRAGPWVATVPELLVQDLHAGLLVNNLRLVVRVLLP